MHSSIASVRLLLQHGANPEAVIGVSQKHDVLTKIVSPPPLSFVAVVEEMLVDYYNFYLRIFNRAK
jgi:hypothetical protein